MTDPKNRHELTPEESQTLEDYLAEPSPPEKRADVEREILASDRLSEALYSEMSLRSALAEATASPTHETRKIDRTKVVRFPVWARIALPLAAVLLIAVLSPSLFRSNDDDEIGTGRRFRSGATQGPTVTEPRGLSPSGEVPSVPSRFVWSRVAHATSYHFELLGAAGEILFSTDSADTSITLPREAFPPDPTLVHAWRVMAVEESAILWSEPVPLRVVAP